MTSNHTHFLGRDFWDGSISMTTTSGQLHSVPNITSPYSACPLDITIFISCYNNANTIIQTLEMTIEAMEVTGNSFEILVIDDGSQDGSGELVRNFMAENEQLHLVLRINKHRKGLAQNYFDGAFMGCGTYYRMVQGDNSEPVGTMVDIFKSIGDADIIVPYYLSRLKEGRFQSLSERLFTTFINIISGNHISCYTAPHVHLRYNVMRWHSDVLGAAFQMDLLCQLLAMDFTCKQVPCRAVSAQRKERRIKSILSYIHATLNIILRRLARLTYAKH